MRRGVDVIAEEAGGLTVAQQVRDRTVGLVGPGGVGLSGKEDGGVFGVLQQEIKLAPDQPPQSLDGGEADHREPRQLGDHRVGGMSDDRLVEAGLGAVVIVDELLVDLRTRGNPLGAGPGQTVLRELGQRRGEQALRSGGLAMRQAERAFISRVNSTRSRPPALAR